MALAFSILHESAGQRAAGGNGGVGLLEAEISGIFQCLAVYQGDHGAVLTLKKGRFEVALKSSNVSQNAGGRQ
ncbi:MAG: hypothetical protein ACREOO_21310 [bacterium]